MTTPDDDVLAVLVPRLAALSAAVSRSDLYERAVAAAGVPVERPALSLLMTLHAAGQPLRVGEIAERQQVAGPHITRTTTELERRGLVRRVTDPADRRARLVELTDDGATAVQRYMRVALRGFGDALSHWSAEDRGEAVRLLTRFIDDVTAALTASNQR